MDLSAPAEPGGTLAGLYPAIARRHTSRYPFADTPIPSPVRDDLREAARLEGAALDFPGPWHVRFLLDAALRIFEHQYGRAPEQLEERLVIPDNIEDVEKLSWPQLLYLAGEHAEQLGINGTALEPLQQ